MQTKTINGPNGKMTIEGLASASNMTVRNIRAHHSRGLLPPPHMQGRKGYYDDAHLNSLKEITALQERGYSLAAIQDLLAGTGLGKLNLGLVAALGAWKEEGPVSIPLDEFLQRFPSLAQDETLLQRVKATGIYVFEGDQVLVPWPALLDATQALLLAGATMESILALEERMLAALQLVAQDVIRFFIEDVLAKRNACKEPDLVAKTVAEIRPLALASFRAWFSHAMESEIKVFFNRPEDKQS